MTILGTITDLSDHLRLDGIPQASAIALSVRPTFGAPVVQRCSVTGGATLSLVASSSGNQLRGLYTKAQVDALAVIRDAGEPVQLIHHLGTFTVIIPPTGLDDIGQVFDYADPGADDWYTGTVTLITV